VQKDANIFAAPLHSDDLKRLSRVLMGTQCELLDRKFLPKFDSIRRKVTYNKDMTNRIVILKMPSSQQPEPSDESETFARMMRLGQACYTQGAHKQAHRYWRRAALIDPGRESVWIALLKVVETDEDRKVCLENILAINPRNRHALRDIEMFRASNATPPTVWDAVWPVIWAIALGTLIALVTIAFQSLQL
jgi:hypothetical protein